MAYGVEWDERKRCSNLLEHGVDFADAALIFLNPVLEAEGTGASTTANRVCVPLGR
jgi:uncharacterized DUF497 family protein